MKSKYIEENLKRLFPQSACELKYTNDYELLLSTMLSAQTTDKKVNEVTTNLYKEYNCLKKLSNLSLGKIEKILKPLGFYKVKAKNFKSIVDTLSSKEYNLHDRNFLESLPGVGRKTANVVLGQLYNEPLIAVDTHVKRVSKILYLAEEKDNELEIEKKLTQYFEGCDIAIVATNLVLFGRYICKSKNPLCNECPFYKKCKKTEVK